MCYNSLLKATEQTGFHSTYTDRIYVLPVHSDLAQGNPHRTNCAVNKQRRFKYFINIDTLTVRQLQKESRDTSIIIKHG